MNEQNNEREAREKNKEAELLDRLLKHLYYGFSGLSWMYIEGCALEDIELELAKKLQTYMQRRPEQFQEQLPHTEPE